MDTIVLEHSLKLGKDISLLLLTFGIKGLPVCTLHEALEAIKRFDTIKFCIIDIDNKSTEGVRFIQEIRQDEHYKDLKIIVHTIQKINQIQSKMAQFGVLGLLSKPFEPAKTSNQIKQILSKIYFPGAEKRHHIRIRPDPDDLIRVHFKLKLYPALVYGKILDISITSMAIELLKSPPRAFLKEGTYIPRLLFSLDYKQISASGIIKLERGKIIIINFHQLVSRAKNTIAGYIFKRIST
ncbi:MAG: response regulator [Spirochaetales bacterium]|nr:response regulator [Spirochaetales bacterium]